MRWIIVTIVLGVLGLVGCATIVGDKTQLLSINSSPEGAEVCVTDETGQQVFKGQTPTTVVLQKADGTYFGGKDYTVSISKEGHETQTAQVVSGPNGWYVGGNFIFGGLIGWLIVDPLSGAMWTLSPETVNLNLAPAAEKTSRDGSRGLAIIQLDDVPVEWRDCLDPLI